MAGGELVGHRNKAAFPEAAEPGALTLGELAGVELDVGDGRGKILLAGEVVDWTMVFVPLLASKQCCGGEDILVGKQVVSPTAASSDMERSDDPALPAVFGFPQANRVVAYLMAVLEPTYHVV